MGISDAIFFFSDRHEVDGAQAEGEHLTHAGHNAHGHQTTGWTGADLWPVLSPHQPHL